MNKHDVIEFFDRCAPEWDAGMVRNEEIIAAILDHAGIKENIHVLDVACGTGVLFPDYIRRGAASVTAIDISPAMAKIAREKFPAVEVICGDVETECFDKQFDAVMVYNAFPHFPDPEGLLRTLAALTVPGGRVSVAHGMSREALLRHHSGRAAKVSVELPEAEQLASLMKPWFEVDTIISDARMYQVVGIRK